METLSPERWARIERLFEELSDLPASRRPAALADLRASDAGLADLLARMLASATGAGDRIAGAIGGAAADLTQPTEWIGHRFGPYEAVREVGRGGMGIVFEAVRADDEYRKRVALKIAPGWRAYPGLVERFRAERQILAELETETIARFLDGGTENGVPYFVMEFVDGEPITDFCARHELSVRDRLQLFRRVCEGVSFAHERLVVHRDLKPANILVTADGTPKLVDFGVAKLLDEAGDTSATATSFPAWTPDYVSPEQVRGRPVSPRTDVYSLGLVLYELLCSERGQQGDTSSLLALDRSVCEREPAPPSERARRRGARSLARAIAGDLDTIVLKAIRKEPDERYSSVSAFIDDVERHLEDRPIRARDVGSGERAVKFVRRHRTAAGFLAVLVGTAAAGVISTIRQAKRAERRFQQVRSLANTFVFDVHDAIANLPGSTDARKQIVSTALTYLESLRADATDDKALLREIAAAYMKVASAQGLPLRTNLGDTAGAAASLETAIALLEPLVSRGDSEAAYLRADALHLLGTVVRARGDREATLALYAQAAEAAQLLSANGPASVKVLELTGSIACDRARLAVELRHYEAAERMADEAMQAAARLVAIEPDRRVHLEGMATALNAKGMAELGTGRLEDAAAHFGESVRIRRELVEFEPEVPDRRRALAVSCGHLADVLGFRIGGNLGDIDGAIAALTEAANHGEWARARDARDRRALYDLANTRVRLGALFMDSTPPRVDEALREFQSALASVDELLAQDPDVAAYRGVQLAVLRRLGDTHHMEGRSDEALDCVRKTIALGEPLFESPTGPVIRGIVALARSRLALILAQQQRVEEAATEAEAAASELERPGIGGPILIAGGHALVAEAFATVAPLADTERRNMLEGAAQRHFEAAATLWREAPLAAPLEPARAAALARIAEKRTAK